LFAEIASPAFRQGFDLNRSTQQIGADAFAHVQAGDVGNGNIIFVSANSFYGIAGSNLTLL
jgi:hypothetical protein